MAKGNPIPTKFEPEEEKLLKWVAKKSGLPVSEVIRRAVFLLNQEVKRRGGKVGWIVEDLMPGDLAPMPGELPAPTLRVATDPPDYPAKAPVRRAAK